ncbi:MAG: Tetratricopeptide repeat [Solirubrobacteraceae bacterium]|jgi:tetratricopeptide (TPR) repeat protein|nr:Tetratricopeptide repeat [Solirubrobacteraceae bacterium]
MNATRLPFVAVALVCATLGVYLAVSSRGEARLGRASAALAAGRNAEVIAELEGLRGEAGSRAHALRGYAYRDTGRLEAARTAFQAAARRDPNNWVLQREYAGVLLRLGLRAKARARMSRAKALNPRMPLPAGFADAK